MKGYVVDYMAKYDFRKLVFCQNKDVGLKAIIAIHSTALGPATGGLRMWTYDSEEAAIMDALRLGRGMTYKYAAAGVNLGGGKAVIIGDPKREKTEALVRAMGRFIQSLKGEYQTGEDVGTTLDDMETLYKETEYVVTLPEYCGGAGDIAPATAFGVQQAMKAAAQEVWGSESLQGRTVALQGLGAVGWNALVGLVKEGATVVVSDIDEAKVERARREFGVKAVSPEEIYDVACDVYGPYALGATLDDRTIPRLRCKVVCGSANNQLAEERHGEILKQKGILYCPDYVANSGGTIFDTDRLQKGGGSRERAWKNVSRIKERTYELFAIAKREGITPEKAADWIAERRLAMAKDLRMI